MIRLFILLLLVTQLSGCLLYHTDNGLSFFKPYYMNKERVVSALDLKIIKQATEILKNKTNWNKNDNRLCSHDEKWSLFCTLAKSSVALDGKYKHRRVSIQEVRFTINEHYSNRWKRHQLMDFNNHPFTTFDEIHWVLNETLKRLSRRYSNQKN